MFSRKQKLLIYLCALAGSFITPIMPYCLCIVCIGILDFFNLVDPLNKPEKQ